MPLLSFLEGTLRMTAYLEYSRTSVGINGLIYKFTIVKNLYSFNLGALHQGLTANN